MEFPWKGQQLHAWIRSRNIPIKRLFLMEPTVLLCIRFRRGHVNASLSIGYLIPEAVCKLLSFTCAAITMRCFHPEGDQLKEEKKTVFGSFTDFSCSVFMGCSHGWSNTVILKPGPLLLLGVVEGE